MVVTMEQRNSTCHAFGPRYSTGTEAGRGNERKGGSLQLRKRGMHVETDRAVALLDFACSPVDPHHPEISGGLRRIQRRDHRKWAFWGCFLARNHRDLDGFWCRRRHPAASRSHFAQYVFLEANEAHSKLWLQSQSTNETPLVPN